MAREEIRFKPDFCRVKTVRRYKLKESMKFFFICGLVFLGVFVRADDTHLTLLPLKSGASLYFGQMFNIDDSLQQGDSFNPTVTLPTTSLWMVQEATSGDRLHFSLGIAGTFWYPFPESNVAGQGWTSYRTGGVAISQAVGTYSVGDLKKPWMQISVGQQGYKYNPYAKNFGEYLFRSEAYPTTVRTGDWGAIDNAGSGIWGVAFKGNFLDGMVKNDFLITMANERTPLHDVSFSNITSLQFGNMFQIGGGVMLSRFLQIDPKKSRPESQATGWFHWTAADQARLSEYLRRSRVADSNFTEYSRNLVSGGSVVDTALAPGIYWAGSDRDLVALVANPIVKDSIAVATGVNKHSSIQYVDTKAVMLVARASFDPKPLMGWADILGQSDLVLYGEMAVLGTKNYPIYYTKISERTTMMAGFYLPTFKQLDYLTVEMEYFKNPHINSDYMMAFYRIPQPKSPNAAAPEIPLLEDPAYPGGSDQYGAHHHEDDLKWTVTAQKSFGIWNLAFQAGTDHYRPLTGSFRPSFTEAATTKDAWYYMLRLMVNI